MRNHGSKILYETIVYPRTGETGLDFGELGNKRKGRQ